jgi:hypothetical protein
MARRVPGMGGAGPTGFEDYPDWEGYADAWPGTAATDPTGIPPAISSDWTTHFRPGDIPGAYDQYQDWAQGEGQDPLPLDRFNDLQYQQGVGPIPDAPSSDPAALASQGYGLQFDPQSTANTGWNLNYDILNPQGQRTGFDLSSTGPYEHFPWVPGGAAYAAPSPSPSPAPITDPNVGIPAPDAGAFPDKEIESTRGDDGGAIQTATDLPDPYAGDLRDDPSITDYPFAVPEQQLIGMTQVGDDPISELINASLASMASTGGLAATPYTGQTQGALSDIMAHGGQGAEIPGQSGWEAQNQFSHLMQQQGRGAEQESALGQDVQATLQDLLASGGQLPADAQRRALEMETLRSPIDAFRSAQLAQGQAELARRGLLGQGPELDFMSRLESRIAPQYAQAGRDLALAEAQRADQRFTTALATAQQMGQGQAQRREAQYQNALNQAAAQGDTAALRREDRLANTLQLATGMSEAQSRNLLATAQTWNDRQQMLSDVVLQSIDRDQTWNRFLAEFGLDRAQTLDLIAQGRINSLLPLLQQFMDQIEIAATGFVPYYQQEEGRYGRQVGETTATRQDAADFYTDPRVGNRTVTGQIGS